MIFKAVEVDLRTVKPTGREELYAAETIEHAAVLCLQRRRGETDGWSMGNSGRIIVGPEHRTWALLEQQPIDSL
jgi:hypothetical protein